MYKAILINAILIFGSLSLIAADYSPLSQEEANAFNNQMDQAVSNAEKNVKQAQTGATRKDIAPTWSSKVQFENAIIQLEVKKTLVSNFKNTESLRSPLVRQTLLNILNKPIITTSDLADLQNLVITEKAKINQASIQAQPKPVPVNP